jgi:hypothetical protein
MHTSPGFHGHAWACAARFDCLDAAFYLLIAICIDVEGACSHDIFDAPTPKIGFVYSHKDANITLWRIEGLHFWPHLIEGSMKNFSVAVSSIAEKLESKFARAGIKTGEEISCHVLVVRGRR